MLKLKDKKVTVFGLGKSGLAVAMRLIAAKAKVFVTDELSESEVSGQVLQELKKLGVEIELGGHTDKAIDNTDLIVVSPGVHLDILVLEEARRRDIPLISEIELAYHFLRKPIIAITGTNGKTTTVTLVGELLKAAGHKVIVAGNIGFPLVSVDDKGLDYVVAEVSSYQLETAINFRPYISAVLNITPDHIERHKTLKDYALAKGNIFKNQKEGDIGIYNEDSSRVKKILPSKANFKLLLFSRKRTVRQGAFVRGGKIIISLEGTEEVIMAKEQVFLKGEHNLENCLAAALIARLCKVPAETIADVLGTFQGVEHRIEYVATVRGISFYNDSKGTNPDSTIVAIRALATESKKKRSNLILIAGGKDKKLGLSAMIKLIKKQAAKVVLIGEIKERFRDELIAAGYREVFLEGGMDEAVKKAFQLAKEGDQIVLSPACSSFDMFANYEERGRIFKRAVAQLKEREK